MARRKLTIADVRAQLPAARARTRALLRSVRGAGVSFERPARQLRIELTNGAALSLPISIIAGLRGATDSEIANVAIDPLGIGLSWEQLDVDVSILGLIQATLGPALLHSAAGAQRGSARSRAKAVAARRNGLKGGRPRKSAGKTI